MDQESCLLRNWFLMESGSNQTFIVDFILLVLQELKSWDKKCCTVVFSERLNLLINMHNIKTNFDKIIVVIKDILRDEINKKGNYLRRGTRPRFSDIKVMALSLTAECLSIDSENYLFSKLRKQYSKEFKNIVSRRQYNDRRKLLFGNTERVRKPMAERLNRHADIFAIDSMPTEICKLSREKRTKMGKESIHHSPDKRYCAFQKKYFYGYKLHSVCSAAGVIESLDLTKASVHDVHYLKNVKELFSNCIITGDKGYIGRQHQFNLF